MERLQKDYPKLPICLQGDALYAAEPIMKICNGNHWKYILTQKDTRQKVTSGYRESVHKRGKTEHKKYIFKITGTIPKPNG